MHDILNYLYRLNSVEKKHDIILETKNKVATDSIDHILPRGTIQDNTRKLSFVKACENYFERKCSYLDLGCSGGGLVRNFLEMDNFSIGVEGSDISFYQKRAEWARIPNHLFTADIRKEFKCIDSQISKNYLFDIIGAWEVMEHIPEEYHNQLFKNIASHLKPKGIFVASISTVNVMHHSCVHQEKWWRNSFEEFGFKILNVYDIFKNAELPRDVNKGKSFHIAITLM